MHEFWKNQKIGDNNEWNWTNSIMYIFEKNSKNIQQELGGKNLKGVYYSEKN
jgi:hypothetical protein